MYVYIRSEPCCWTVGHHAPGGWGKNHDFHPESDHSTPEAAARRAAWLNGSADPELLTLLDALEGHLRHYAEGWVVGYAHPTIRIGVPELLERVRTIIAREENRCMK